MLNVKNCYLAWWFKQVSKIKSLSIIKLNKTQIKYAKLAKKIELKNKTLNLENKFKINHYKLNHKLS